MQSYQREADRLFENLEAGKTTRAAYVAALDVLYETLPAALKRKVKKRKDERTLGRFALQIYDTTRRERFLVEEWIGLFEGEEVSLRDSGVANDGRLVLDPASGTAAVDYVLTHRGDESKLEVKFGPTQSFVTFKMDDLYNYASQHDVHVLVIIADTRMMGPNGDPGKETHLAVPRGTAWFLLDNDRIATVLSHGQQGKHQGFGGKETVRVYRKDFLAAFGGLGGWYPQEYPLATAGCGA